jgi:hypothetical protein
MRSQFSCQESFELFRPLSDHLVQTYCKPRNFSCRHGLHYDSLEISIPQQIITYIINLVIDQFPSKTDTNLGSGGGAFLLCINKKGR